MFLGTVDKLRGSGIIKEKILNADYYEDLINVNKNESDEMIFCPLVNEKILPVDCMENQDLKDSSVPDKFKTSTDWRKICEKCKYYDY